MKKIFNFLLVIMVMMMPMVTNARTITAVTNDDGSLICVDGSKEGELVCTVSIDIVGGNVAAAESVKFGLTPVNVTIDINSIEAKEGWNFDSLANSDLANLEFVAGKDHTGQVEVFSFTYQKDLTATDCKVTLSVNGLDTVVPETPGKDEDPVEEVKTGVTLPYLFLGGAVLVAGYALISTRNKSKMHRI